MVGTAAELIKIFPLISKAQREGRSWYLVSTGQNGKNLERQYQDFNLPEEKVIHLNPHPKDLRSGLQALFWLIRMLCYSPIRLPFACRSVTGNVPGKQDYWFVHGDTFTTLLGAILGRLFGLRVVHVEAGMRSGDLLNPFPEEANRRIVSRLAQFHMCPDEKAAEDLRREGIKGKIVVTGGNTVIDSLNTTLEALSPSDLPKGPYALANIHRFENLANDERWSFMIDTLVEAAERHRIVLVLLPPTEAKLESDPESKKRLLAAGVELLPRQTFSRFMHMMHNADFIISDGGSNQQEAYYLGKPCLLLRKVTESREGIGTTCVLSEFDRSKVRHFLQDPNQFRGKRVVPQERPTDISYRSLGIDL